MEVNGHPFVRALRPVSGVGGVRKGTCHFYVRVRCPYCIKVGTWGVTTGKGGLPIVTRTCTRCEWRTFFLLAEPEVWAQQLWTSGKEELEKKTKRVWHPDEVKTGDGVGVGYDKLPKHAQDSLDALPTPSPLLTHPGYPCRFTKIDVGGMVDFFIVYSHCACGPQKATQMTYTCFVRSELESVYSGTTCHLCKQKRVVDKIVRTPGTWSSAGAVVSLEDEEVGVAAHPL